MDAFIVNHAFLWLLAMPWLGFVLSVLSSFGPETVARKIVSWTSHGIFVISIFMGVILWRNGLPYAWETNLSIPFVHESVHVALLYDHVALVFSWLASFLTWIVVQFSSVYLVGEKGYARFFSFVYLLLFGVQTMAVADHLTVFFCGWEFVGLASFFLISFYREHAAPVANSLKVFAVYRIGDLGFLFALLFWHQMELQEHVVFSLSHAWTPMVAESSWTTLLLALGVIMAAAAKSGQYPFCGWLPRAMEGPTPSSAIFYGALAIHVGVLLLLRTTPVWFPLESARWVLGFVGVASFFHAHLLGKAQSSIKAQLAYSSIAQVGLMFFEMAWGWMDLVLVHVCMHALMRSYQLLLSPSVVAFSLRKPRFFHKSISIKSSRLRATCCVYALQEGYIRGVQTYVSHLFRRA
jgi:NADH-quinone oxidoreductase subunit L